jgi:hypothetical protein
MIVVFKTWVLPLLYWSDRSRFADATIVRPGQLKKLARI